MLQSNMNFTFQKRTFTVTLMKKAVMKKKILEDESSHVRSVELVNDAHNGSNLMFLDRQTGKEEVTDVRSLSSAGQDENSSVATLSCLQFCK